MKTIAELKHFQPKKTFLAIFANFGQFWMVDYTAIIKIFKFFKIYRMGVTKKVKKFEIDPIFAKKSYSTNTDGGGEFVPPPKRGLGLISIKGIKFPTHNTNF